MPPTRLGWHPPVSPVPARLALGACNNLLAPGTLLDVPSNNAAINGIPVEVEAA